MEDGIERSINSLNSQNNMYFEESDDEKLIKPILYLCWQPNEKFSLNKCIITDDKEKINELLKQKFRICIFERCKYSIIT